MLYVSNEAKRLAIKIDQQIIVRDSTTDVGAAVVSVGVVDASCERGA